MTCADAFRKAVAGGLSAALLLASPGSQAFAAKIAAPVVAPTGLPTLPVGAAAALRIPRMTSGLPAMTAPAMPSPTLTTTPAALAPTAMPARAVALPAAIPTAAAVLQPDPLGRVAAPLAGRQDAPGLVGVIGHNVSGRSRDLAPEAASFVAPSAGVIASPQASREWGEASFSALRGDSSGGAVAAPVDRAGLSRRTMLGRPGPAANGIKADELPAPGGSTLVTAAKWAIPVALGLGALGVVTGFIPLPALSALTSYIPTFGLSWPALIGINVGVMLAVQIGKKLWANHTEKSEKAAEKAAKLEAAKDLAPATLEGEAAAQALTARLGTNEGVSIYDYSTGQNHVIPVEQALIDHVKAGEFKVVSDNTGAMFVVPVLVKPDDLVVNGVSDSAEATPEPAALKTADPTPTPAASTDADALARQAEAAAASKALEDAVEAIVPAEAASAPKTRRGANPTGLAGKKPRSFSQLPADARKMDAEALSAGKAKAQARARKKAPDARLVRVTINLDDPRAHPVYVFHSRKTGQILTVWEKRIGVKKGTIKGDTLWDSGLQDIAAFSEAYTALKAGAHWFAPVRVELAARRGTSPVWVFTDARGRTRRVPA